MPESWRPVAELVALGGVWMLLWELWEHEGWKTAGFFHNVNEQVHDNSPVRLFE